MRARWPETSLFSSVVPSGSSIREPSFATLRQMILVSYVWSSRISSRNAGYSHDDSSAEHDVAAERDVSSDGQVVHLEQRGNRLESLLELGNLLGTDLDINNELEASKLDDAGRDLAGEGSVFFTAETHLLEVVAELDDRSRLEHALRVHRELAVLELVQVRGDEEQVGARLDGQETRSRHVDAVSVLEVYTGAEKEVSRQWQALSAMGNRDKDPRLIAAPTAVSSWMTASPLSLVLLRA